MQRPPAQGMPILLARPANEWIARINQKHKQLAALQLSAGQKEELDRWTEIEFVCSTLKLEGIEVQRSLVARIASLRQGSSEAPDSELATALLESLRTVMSIARTHGKDARLTVELLLKLHDGRGADGFRRSVTDATLRPTPVAAEHLPAVLENACRWFTAESFAELHPIEQASIGFLRLIEIHPFEQMNVATALVAASLFTLRCGLPPLIIPSEMQAAYRAALNQGQQMNTKPMVELVATAVETTLIRGLRVAQGERD